MALSPATYAPLMCLTQDGLALDHVEQAGRLCAAGARWIQLRMKAAGPDAWLAVARAVVAVCRRHGAVCIVNDSVEVALASNADGVHLGSLDLDWREARRHLGPARILGGTVNNSEDAARAVACGCLDYVGVGPWRFTRNKLNLAPILGPAGIRAIVTQLRPLPVWVIGGIEAEDLPLARDLGAAGAAVSSALYREGKVEENFRLLQAAWRESAAPAASAPRYAETAGISPPECRT